MQDKFDVMAAEADKFVDAITSPRVPSDKLLRSGLANDYDVIVSETMDYIISKRREKEFLMEISLAAENSDSYLIRSRARVVAALADSDKLRDFLKMRHKRQDSYYAVWDSAAKYIETKDRIHLSALDSYAHGDDMTILSLSKSLKRFVTQNI